VKHSATQQSLDVGFHYVPPNLLFAYCFKKSGILLDVPPN
jgi:hypothetical protein